MVRQVCGGASVERGHWVCDASNGTETSHPIPGMPWGHRGDTSSLPGPRASCHPEPHTAPLPVQVVFIQTGFTAHLLPF